MKTFMKIFANQLKCSPVAAQWGALPHHTGPENDANVSKSNKNYGIAAVRRGNGEHCHTDPENNENL